MFVKEDRHKIMREGFVQLHNHTNYSLLDGAVDIDKMTDKALENGQKALAITDHGNVFGLVEFQKSCVKKGIKPILGCEVYIAPGSRFDREASISKKDNLFVNARYHHLILLVKNEIGYKNLNKLVSLSYKEGFYYKPRIDMELLERYSEGLVCSSACLGGAVPQAYLRNAKRLEPGFICPYGYEAAKEVALKYKNIFKDDFYLELQNHGIYDQQITNPVMLKISKEEDIPFIITNDAHYVNKEDAEMHDILMRIQIGATIKDDVKMEFETDEFYLKSYDEMREVFKDPIYDEGFLNTKEIADKCNFLIEFGQYHLPKYDIPKEFNDSKEYLEYLSFKGLKDRFETDDLPNIYKERLEHELETINNMGFDDYFLITWDFIKFARDNNIAVGPGRGSAAGSLVAYALRIVDIDPIKFNLLFERFLNPERVSMPDIDIDFCTDRRQEVIDYVVEKYGQERVANIVTFGTLSAKSVIKDVSRVYDFRDEKGSLKFSPDFLTKLLKPYTTESIEEIVENDEKIQSLIERDSDFRQIISIAIQLEGFPRHASTHAAGVVIGGSDLNNHIATFMNDGVHTTQFDMNELEEMGLLKMDFLGLRNLTIIEGAIELINRRVRKEHISFCKENGVPFREEEVQYLDSENIPRGDKKTFELLSRGDTTGVFQLESSGMKEVLTSLQPKNVEELTACISLYRPGPMDNIPDYIKNKNNPENIKYLHPSLEEILEPTYGIIVYQEQVMQVFQDLGGFSLGRADIVRRAMGKKDMDIMKKEEEIFIYGLKDENGNFVLDDNGQPLIPGAISKGINPEIASAIVDQMTDFASYAFNKSHASAYAEIAYRTAYLKANYPVEYATSLLSSIIGRDKEKVNQYIREVANNMNVEVKAPDISISEEKFTTDGQYVYYGLTAIDHVGVDFSHKLVEERKRGPFKSFFDFIYRMVDKGLTTLGLESLIKSGSLDQFGNRNSLLYNAENFLEVAKNQHKKYKDSQNLFELIEDIDYQKEREPEFIEIEEMDINLLLSYEYEVLSFYVSGHPFDIYYKDPRVSTVRNILKMPNNNARSIYVMAQLSSRRNIKTKNGDDMAFITLSDRDGESLDAVLFPNHYLNNSAILNLKDSSNVFILKGDIGFRNGEKQFIIKETFLPSRTEKEFESFLKRNNINLGRKRKKRKHVYNRGFYFKVSRIEEFKPIAQETKHMFQKGDIDFYIYVMSERAIKKLSVPVSDSYADFLKKKYPDKTLYIK